MPVIAPPRNATASASLSPVRAASRRAHVRAHRDVHADVAGKARQHRADGEAAGGAPAEEDADDDEQDDADDADRHVLAVQVGLGAGLDRGGDLLHPRVARRLGEDPADGHRAVDDRRDRADEREDERLDMEISPSKECDDRERAAASAIAVGAAVARSRSCGRTRAAVRWSRQRSCDGPAAAKTRYFASARSKKSSRSCPQNSSPR